MPTTLGPDRTKLSLVGENDLAAHRERKDDPEDQGPPSSTRRMGCSTASGRLRSGTGSALLIEEDEKGADQPRLSVASNLRPAAWLMSPRPSSRRSTINERPDKHGDGDQVNYLHDRPPARCGSRK